jgi:uncharacterized protein YggE
MRSVRMAAIGFVVLALRSPLASAQSDTAVQPKVFPSTLNITAQASARMPADRATLYLIVDASAGTPSQASERATTTARAAIDTLRRLGLGPQATRLTNYGAAPGVGAVGGAGPIPGATFAARSVIRVELQRLELLSTVATAAFNTGATLIGPIQFSAATSDSGRRAALVSALSEARQDAEEMARAAGGRLGRLLDVSMHSTASPQFTAHQLPLGGQQYQYDAASAWRTPPEVIRSWNVTTRWEILPAAAGK